MQLHMTKSETRMKFQKASRITGKLAVNMRDQGLSNVPIPKLGHPKNDEEKKRKISASIDGASKVASRKASTGHHSQLQLAEQSQEASVDSKIAKERSQPAHIRNINIAEAFEPSEIQISDFNPAAS